MEHGSITKWNDEKGFGFITSDSNTQEVFFHITSLTDRRRRPNLGDRVFFDVTISNAGRTKASHVSYSTRTHVKETKASSHNSNSSWSPINAQSKYRKAKKSVGKFVLAIIIPVAAASLLYKNFGNRNDIIQNPASEEQPEQIFRCEGKRNCGQMNSKEEAQFYLHNCPNDGMDGDNDGSACEAQFGE